MRSPVRLREEEIQRKLEQLKIPFHFKDGSTQQLKLNFRDSYKDGSTGEMLQNMNIREAIADELPYLCREVVEGDS